MLLAQSCRRETTTALEVAVPAPQALLSDAVQELKAWFFSHGRASFKRLKHAHARIVRLRLEQDCYLLNLLLKSLFESGNFRHARLLFDRIPSPNIYLWNTAVRGLVSADQWEEALRLYSLMRREGMCPNNFTFPFVLKACARILELQLGQKVHAHLCKCGLERDVFVKTSLLCLYAKCGHLNHAQALFDEMPEPSVISWTAIITGYMEEGKLEEALGLFKRMLQVGLEPDSFTLVRVLCICSQLGDSQAGERIHRYIQEKAMHCNVFVATSLVDMYAKCGDMERARQVFEQMPERDVVTWSTMVAGYSSNGFPRVAVEMFFRMQEEKVEPDCFTMVGLLSACAKLGALQLGHSASGLLDRRLFLCNPVLGTALIDMYAKCGDVGTAWAVFRAMESRDLISWNAMISGLAMNGLTKVSFSLFAQLEKSGLRPDGNTFIGLLCSCTHAGMVEEGRRYFHSMASIYSLVPKVEHYGCMVDLLGRSGLLGDARRLIQQMPVEANAVVWGALLSSCRIHRDARMAEDALKRLIELEPRNSGNYVLLSNLYASSGRWREAATLRRTMQQKGIEKVPGCSWVEFAGTVHEFRAGDRSHPLQEEIYAKLEELGKEMKAMGYMPTTEVVMFDVEEEEKEAALGHHSEKLAIAFGLISAAPGDAIRVVKNLRVCADCHAAIKLISKISAREIVVRDNNRFHCFRDGSCSCRDFW
ncbi:unnamed protein product [Spirodela intermedia]|uniref:DYW domain-containing protein n=1 Tax=Spirodela intermedia TaxID=51605 RepID=A0A7I8JZ53_SPIIN|nr:unnamed protein product [Spirodela intermedia]